MPRGRLKTGPLRVRKEGTTWVATRDPCVGHGRTRESALAALRQQRRLFSAHDRKGFLCQHCDGKMGAEMAIVQGGADRVVGPWRGKRRSTTTFELGDHFDVHEAVGFLDFFCSSGTRATIVDGATYGRFGLYFCSIRCLRDFMNARIDELSNATVAERR